MSSLLIYTFRTVSCVSRLGDDVFVLGKLKEDSEALFELIKNKKPDVILGIGNSATTAYESQAINHFHQKTIIYGGPESYSLYVPKSPLANNSHATKSFCNWSAYRIAHFIVQNKITSRLSFLHMAPGEIQIIRNEITNLGTN